MIGIENLSCGYPGFTLRIPDLNIPSGKISCVIGPNGSGKSTLIKAINGFMSLQSGSIRLDENPLASIGLKERARIMATVSQHNEFPDLSVREFLLLGRIPHQRTFQFHPSRNDLMALENAISSTGIEFLLERRLLELSGGERQLCQITRALVQEPSILLLDEPSNFLDIGHQVRALDLVRKLTATRYLTVIMVLHDLNLAGEYSDRLLLMDKGAPFRWGTAEEVLNFENIEAVYETPVFVQSNPLNGKPHVFIVSAESMETSKRANRPTHS